MSAKRLAIFLAVLAVLPTCQSSCLAKSKQQDNQSKDSNNSPAGAFDAIGSGLVDPTTAMLLWRTSHKPELMNVDYLKHFLGNPEPQTSQIGPNSHSYIWYDQMRQKKCELYQEFAGPGQMVGAAMIMHLPQGGFSFADLDKKLGPPLRSFYDHDAHPSRMYSYAPGTTISMASPSNSFCVSKATVTYQGSPLPPIAFEDMLSAHDHFRAKTQTLTSGNVNWQNELVKARERVAMFPAEAESHVALAQALKGTGNLHDAITEYKTAMGLNKFNPALRQQCVEALKGLKVLPADYAEQSSGTGVATRDFEPGF